MIGKQNISENVVEAKDMKLHGARDADAAAKLDAT